MKARAFFLLACMVATACTGTTTGTGGLYTRGRAEGPAQTAYAPPRANGPIVMVLSGSSGPQRYDPFAARVASEGYYVVLLDGNDVLTADPTGEANLRKAIERAQRAPNARPGKVAVIGFSLGGGAALVRAAKMTELVLAVIVYYPYTAFVTRPGTPTDAQAVALLFRVPILVLTGEQDRYRGCCYVETARALEAAAKVRGAQFTLVTYPNAAHGFNLAVAEYRATDAEDAWMRTVEMLRQHHPP